jgi:hypothetical protein
MKLMELVEDMKKSHLHFGPRLLVYGRDTVPDDLPKKEPEALLHGLPLPP